MPSNDVAVSVRGLSKSYSIAKNAAKHTTAGEALMHRLRHPFAREERETFWALNDVSFDIQKGDVVGIIGRNGAGKSTLLKILSRITEPTSGRIDLYGRVGSLLEVGTGFHAELTGRENIFLNGAILGMSRAEIARQFDAIVDFSGVEQFLDTPVKRYSSGMYVRLAFAVAAHLNPEILIVDEVLAVGDAEFQKKCLGKMQDVAQSGRTVLFVSHNMAAVRQLCNKSLVLRFGKVVHSGSVEQGVNEYLSASSSQSSIALHATTVHEDVKIDSILVNNSSSDRTNLRAGQQTLSIVIHGELAQPMRIEMEARITDLFGAQLGLFSPGHDRGFTPVHAAGPFCLARTVELPSRLNRGEYHLHLAVTDPGITGWADIPHAVRILAEGTPTDTGQTIDYYSGAGWLFLGEAYMSDDITEPTQAEYNADSMYAQSSSFVATE